MSKIGQLAHQIVFLVDRKQLSVNVFINFQTLFQPKYVLGANINPIQPKYLPSSAIIRSFTSVKAKEVDLGTKYIRRRFTPEEDQQLLEHVSVHGRTQKSFKDLAESLDRNWVSVQRRCYKLSKGKYDTKTNFKAWDYDEDEKLVNHIFQNRNIASNDIAALMIIKPSEFKDIAEDMKRSTGSLYQRWRIFVASCLIPQIQDLATSNTLREDVLKIVARSHQKTTIIKGYSEYDKRLIIKQVELKGNAPKTWEFIAKKVGKTKKSVKEFYFNSILRTPKVNGPFSSEEDEIILRHVEANGKYNKSFKDLAKDLDRCSPASIRLRHDKLTSTNHFDIKAKQKVWELDEDMSLINHIIDIKGIKANDIPSLETVKLNEFNAVAKELKRSSSSCYGRWFRQIVPTLKTHIKSLPLTSDWKEDILSHIVRNKIKHKKEIDFEKFLKENAPGQTNRSILSFLSSINPDHLPLYKLVSKRPKKKRTNNRLYNENDKWEQKRLEWCQNVISYYKTLI